MILPLKIAFFAILRNILMICIIIERECKQCKTKNVLKPYYDNKDRILQKQRDKH